MAQVSESGELTERKAVYIGIKPITLSRFTMHGTSYVFAATDRPAIVHERSGKLTYSPVNESDVTMLCRFSSDAFPGALAMAKDDSLMIVHIDAIQKLHIRCAPAPCARTSLQSVRMQDFAQHSRVLLPMIVAAPRFRD